MVAALAGVTTLILLYRKTYGPARLSALTAVTAVVTGWGVGQYPWILVDQTTIAGAAGAHATLRGLLIVVALAAIIVLPASGYLLRLTQTQSWSRI